MGVAEARGSTLITNDLGDVCAVVRDGARQPLEPDDWGWLGGKGRNRPDRRRSLEQVRILPGFTVIVGEGRRIDPGPKPARPASFGDWPSGAAPAAAARSKGGV